MSYPLSDTARYVWERIDCLVTELLRVPNSRRYVIALFSGDRPEEFPSRLLVELQALSDEHWPLIEPMIPESCTDGLDLRRREVWADSLGQTDLDPTLVSKLRGMFFRSLDRAASYVLERDRAAAAGGEQGGAGAGDADEWTLAKASRETDVPSWAWSRGAAKPPDKPGHLPTRRVGDNVYVTRENAKAFARDFDARREQRKVGSKSKDGRNIVAALKEIKKTSKRSTERNSK